MNIETESSAQGTRYSDLRVPDGIAQTTPMLKLKPGNAVVHMRMLHKEFGGSSSPPQQVVRRLV